MHFDHLFQARLTIYRNIVFYLYQIEYLSICVIFPISLSLSRYHILLSLTISNITILARAVTKAIQGTAVAMRNILAITRFQGDGQMGFPPEKNIVIDLIITNKRLVTLCGAVIF